MKKNIAMRESLLPEEMVGEVPNPGAVTRMRYWMVAQRAYVVTMLVLLMLAGLSVSIFLYYFLRSYQEGKSNDAWFLKDTLVVGYVSGQMLKFLGVVLLVPMFRNIWTWVRAHSWGSYLPVDALIWIHKIAGVAFVALAITHAASFYAYAMKSGFEEFFAYPPDDPYVFTRTFVEFVTGNVALGLLVVIAGFAFHRIRRRHYELFYYSHHVFIPFYIVFAMHGVDFWMWIIAPMTVYIFDRMLWTFTKKYNVNRVDACLLPGGVMQVEMPRGSFRFSPGQFVYLNCPEISFLQWHPFTISSAPDEDNLRVHIKTSGDWTKRLEKLLCPAHRPSYDSNNATKLSTGTSMRLAGPYGAPAQKYGDYEVAIFVGGGIGNTPFVSILRSLRLNAHRLQTQSQEALEIGSSLELSSNSAASSLPPILDTSRLKRVYFHSCIPDQNSLLWFSDVTSSLRDFPQRFLHVHIYLTQVVGKRSAATSFWDRVADPESLSSSVLPTLHYQRPNFPSILAKVASKHPGARVGLFFCGPKKMGEEVQSACVAWLGVKSSTSFHYHPELFHL